MSNLATPVTFPYHRVIVAGIGALGSEVVKTLGLLGCEAVLLVDPEIVEEVNIARSILYRDKYSLGRAKVDCALEYFRVAFPRTNWAGTPWEIADANEEIISQSDLIFTCVDTDLARTETAMLSNRHGIPVCDGGLGGYSHSLGRVTWLPGGAGACFSCLLTSRRRAEILSLWESSIYSCWMPNDQESPRWSSVPSMASMIGGLQVETALRARSKTSAFSIEIDLDSDPISRTIRHPKSQGCPLHDALEDGALSFPICQRAECRSCGFTFEPQRRIAWLKRRGSCPVCASRNLSVRESQTHNADKPVGKFA